VTFAAVEDVERALVGVGYLPDRGLATAVFLAATLEQPLLLEGEAGVGKTEVARALAEAQGARLIRLQCHEGIDLHHAVYDWDYQRQLLAIRAAEAGAEARELFGREFLLRRPLLYLKSINGSRTPSDLQRVQEAAAGRPDIVLSDGYVDGERLTALTALCDCYVSLHRSEGFGLTIAEAMAFGKPAIATGYSGNLAFMEPDSSYLVPYAAVTLEDAVGPYPAGTEWADPDLDEAARLMRRVFDDPDEAADRGARGKAVVEERQSLEQAARFLGDRIPQLDRLRLEREARETPGSRAAEFLAFGPALSWDARSRGPVGRLYRKLLRRLLRPYTLRQRELETLLANGLEDLEASRDRLDTAVRQLEERLRELER